MARPLRLQFPGAVYHLTARGNARQDIYLDDTDRHAFLRLLDRAVQQQGWHCYAYCLMCRESGVRLDVFLPHEP
jgi:putative transposase